MSVLRFFCPRRNDAGWVVYRLAAERRDSGEAQGRILAGGLSTARNCIAPRPREERGEQSGSGARLLENP